MVWVSRGNGKTRRGVTSHFHHPISVHLYIHIAAVNIAARALQMVKGGSIQKADANLFNHI